LEYVLTWKKKVVKKVTIHYISSLFFIKTTEIKENCLKHVVRGDLVWIMDAILNPHYVYKMLPCYESLGCCLSVGTLNTIG